MSQKTSLLGSIKWQPPSLDHLRDVASNYSNVLMFLLFVGVAILQIWWKRVGRDFLRSLSIYTYNVLSIISFSQIRSQRQTIQFVV